MWFFGDSFTRKVWITLLAIAAAFFLGWCVTWPLSEPGWEPRLRLTGLILQLLGIGTVAKGLHDTRKRFERRGLWESWRASRKRFPPFKADYSYVGSGSVRLAGVGALTGFGTVSATTDRIGALERQVEQHDALIRGLQGRIEQESRERKTALDSERSERLVQDEVTRKKLEDEAAGGLHLEVMGVVWLFAGTVLATAPTEILKLL